MTYINNTITSPALRQAQGEPDPATTDAMDMVKWASEMNDKLARLQMFGMAAKKLNDQQ